MKDKHSIMRKKNEHYYPSPYEDEFGLNNYHIECLGVHHTFKYLFSILRPRPYFDCSLYTSNHVPDSPNDVKIQIEAQNYQSVHAGPMNLPLKMPEFSF